MQLYFDFRLIYADRSVNPLVESSQTFSVIFCPFIPICRMTRTSYLIIDSFSGEISSSLEFNPSIALCRQTKTMFSLVVATVFFLLPLSYAQTRTFTNPLKTRDGSDPFMVHYEGYYYLLATTWSNVQITRATTISGLKTATPTVVWSDSTAVSLFLH